MIKKIIGIGLVVLLIAVLFLSGIIPLSIMGTLNTTTQQRWFGNAEGTGELMSPAGYISSWKPDGRSERITIQGRIRYKQQGLTLNTQVQKYYYLVEGFNTKTNSWITLANAHNNYFSTYIDGTMPVKSVPSGLITGGTLSLESYNFHIIGPDIEGIRVTLMMYIKWDYLSPWQWTWMQKDEAYIYSGYGGLYLPRGLEDENPNLAYSTFEVGQTVRIGVETAKGGYAGDGMPWRVTLNRPHSGAHIDMADPTSSGAVMVEKFYPDDCSASNTFFEFTVTKEMADISMSTSLPFTVRIWNILSPKGTLNIDFVDFLYKCPGSVIFSGPVSVEVGKTATVSMDAVVNSQTQAAIDCFRVSVVYGTANTLLPSDWGSNRWIVHTTYVGGLDKTACSLPQSISFTPTRKGYVTVFAKAIDIQGRPSKTTECWTIHFWEDTQPPSDTYDDETGQTNYGGGRMEPWLPWEPGESEWYTPTWQTSQILRFLIIGVVIALFAVIAFFMPIPGGILGKLIVFIIGIIIAFLIYLFM